MYFIIESDLVISFSDLSIFIFIIFFVIVVKFLFFVVFGGILY